MVKPAYYIFVFLLLFAVSHHSVAQTVSESDTASYTGSFTIVEEDTTLQDSFVLEEPLGEPTRAALLGSLIPGMGQAFNKQYWKIPFVYGGYVVFASLIDFNHVRYIRFRDALALASDNNDATVPEEPFSFLSNDQLRRGRDRFRRDRDFNIILTFMWYGLTIADATVDAHLRHFDISEDLAGSFRPGLINNDFNVAAAGVTFTLYFKP